jgi:aromatic ring-cleaving dioxygenase
VPRQVTTGGKPRPVGIRDPRSITEYHAHVYYDPATTRGRAERLRQCVAAEFPQAKLGAKEARPPKNSTRRQVAQMGRKIFFCTFSKGAFADGSRQLGSA